MSQVEAARLFIQLARQAENRTGYVISSESQIARILKEKPVGPKTLERIAESMWDRRDEPDRDPQWWATQYSRCESARRSGSWFTVSD